MHSLTETPEMLPIQTNNLYRIVFYSRIYTEQQAANWPVRLVARAAVLDRGRQIGGLFWSADFPPQRVHLFPPRLLSKNEAAMCQCLREVGGGVDDLYCSATHSRGVLKPGNS